MGLDSLEFVLELEKEFNFRAEDEKWAQVHIIKDIIDLIWEHCDREKFETKESVEAKFKEVFQRCFGIKDEEYDSNKSIVNDYGID